MIVVGFIIGVLGGFFGVGGSFSPVRRCARRLAWNFAVGTDLAHIVGKSIVAAKKHRALGNVDLKLGLIMAFGTIAAPKPVRRLIEAFKRHGDVNLVVSIVSIIVYYRSRSSWHGKAGKLCALAKKRRAKKRVDTKKDQTAFAHITRKFRRCIFRQ